MTIKGCMLLAMLLSSVAATYKHLLNLGCEAKVFQIFFREKDFWSEIIVQGKLDLCRRSFPTVHILYQNPCRSQLSLGAIMKPKTNERKWMQHKPIYSVKPENVTKLCSTYKTAWRCICPLQQVPMQTTWQVLTLYVGKMEQNGDLTMKRRW